jgi:protein tyrosine/serine phosphatase
MLHAPQTSARRSSHWLARASILLLIAFTIWLVATHAGRWKDRFVARKFRVVEPGQIYASGQIDRRLIRNVLQQNHINTIVCLVADDPSDPDVAAELAACRELGIDRFDDPLSGDGTGDIHAYADAITQVVDARRENRVVLVHCSSGAQRSNGATFFYRVFVQGWNADRATAEMIRNSHDPHNNPALIPYLNAHMTEMAGLLRSHGIIDHIPNPMPRIQGKF